MEKAGTDQAVMVGDSTWDCVAAGRAGIETVAVLTGGFAEAELREAGAAAVFESIEELRARLDETPFAREDAPDGGEARELPRQA
jgi:phosphoglycolate phosphatase-like HAD superfamily hydrolase